MIRIVALNISHLPRFLDELEIKWDKTADWLGQQQNTDNSEKVLRYINIMQMKNIDMDRYRKRFLENFIGV